MINKTALKEERNSWLWIIWTILLIIFSLSFPCLFDTTSTMPFAEKVALSVVLFCFVSVVYRVLTFCFNFILAKIVKKRWKIDRLKGRVSPIYRLIEGSFGDFQVIKYSTKYTNLELQWSIPFSTLFEEQDYIVNGEYFTNNIPTDLAEFWEGEHNLEKCVEDSISHKKTIKKQKIDNLNKVFNENYK